MKKILFFINDLSEGGAEKALLALLRNLDFNRFEVEICLIYGNGVYINDIPTNVKVYSFFPSHRSLNSLLPRLMNRFIGLINNPILSWYINKKLNKRYDVIVAFLEGRSTRYVSLIRSTALKIAWIHCDMLECRWTQDAYKNLNQEKETYQNMDHVVFVSENAKEQFNRLFSSIGSMSQQVIPNVVDQREICKKSGEFILDKRKFTMTLVGRLTPVKGIERFIHVVEKLKLEGFDFDVWILGNGILEMPLKEIVERKGLQDMIFFKGFQKNSYPYIKISDVYLSVSFSEGYSLTIAEALCLGTPVIATYTAGSKTLLQEGNFGMLVDNSEDSIYSGLKKFIQDESLRKEYHKKSIEGAAQFEISKTTELFYHLIENKM